MEAITAECMRLRFSAAPARVPCEDKPHVQQQTHGTEGRTL